MSELARLFLRLGALAFGGPAAHVAMMRAEVVGRRRWLEDDEFLDLVGATALIPGPNSTELAIWLGHRREGWRGLVVAGVCFIAPATAIVVVLAELYVRSGDTPAVDSLRYGVLPVIVAVIAHAVWGLGRTAARSPFLASVGLGAFGLRLVGVDELVVLVAGALVAALVVNGRRLGGLMPVILPFGLPFGLVPAVELDRLFLVFLKAGSLVFGSGYVLSAFLEGDLVDRLGWLTEAQFLDAIAVGQVTPGPVFTTATFVGYLVRGLPGAAVATIGIFLPSFLLVALLNRLLAAVQRSPTARSVLDGVNATAVGLMAGVLVDLAGSALVDPWTALIALAALALLLTTTVNVTWLVAAGALASGVHAVAT